MHRVPLRVFDLSDESAARLSVCSKAFDTPEFSNVRTKVRKMYAFLDTPTAEAIDDHMRWYSEQNINVSDHLSRVWKVISERFESYPADQRDEIVRYMCSYHRSYLGMSYTSFMFFLQDPRRPSPGYFWRWSGGRWVYDPTLSVCLNLDMVHRVRIPDM